MNCCILRMGLGRDSTTMLCLLAEGHLRAQGRTLTPDQVDAVVFSDPGAEWPATYALLPRVQAFCQRIGVPFFWQQKPPETAYQPYLARYAAWMEDRTVERGEPGWRGAAALETRRDGGRLTSAEVAALEARCASGFYHANAPILEDYQTRKRIIQIVDASCTTNHKVAPGRRLMADIAAIRFGVPDNRAWGVRVRKGQVKPHLVLLGFAADEAGRAERMREEASVDYEQNEFPLLEAGIARADETPILERHGFGDVQKSGCMFCKFQGLDWWWALSVTDPTTYARVLGWEAISVEAARQDGRPVSDARIRRGALPLDAQVQAWRAQHPEATPDQVFRNEYRNCVSRYKEGNRQLALFGAT